uniref:Uncharacterized protein n=4 Tax=Oryza TaxID=4527 RepID=A0A0E0Q5E1_ORYRU
MVKCNRLHLITKSNRADGYLLSNPTTPQPPLFPSICTLSLPHHSSMGWLHSLFSPLRRLWVRAHSERRNRRGMYILYKDVQSCQDEDVHVLWSILIDSHRHPALMKLKL